MRWQKTARLVDRRLHRRLRRRRLRRAAQSRAGRPTAGRRRRTIDDKAVVQTLGGVRLEARRQGRQGRVLDQVAEPEASTTDGRNVSRHVDADAARPGRPDDHHHRRRSGATRRPTARRLRRPPSSRGNVKLRTSDGLEVTCRRRAPTTTRKACSSARARCTFTRGRMTGKGVGATYDRNRDVLWLLDQAQIAVDAGREGRRHARGHRRHRRPRARRPLHPAHEGRARRRRQPHDRRRRPHRDAHAGRPEACRSMQLRGNSRIVGTGAERAVDVGARTST